MRKRIIIGITLILYSSLSSYFLMYFIVLFARRHYFYFIKSLIVGFAIGEAKFKDIYVAVSFFICFL